MDFRLYLLKSLYGSDVVSNQAIEDLSAYLDISEDSEQNVNVKLIPNDDHIQMRNLFYHLKSRSHE